MTARERQREAGRHAARPHVQGGAPVAPPDRRERPARRPQAAPPAGTAATPLAATSAAHDWWRRMREQHRQQHHRMHERARKAAVEAGGCRRAPGTRPPPIHAAGRQSVCSRTIRNTSHAGHRGKRDAEPLSERDRARQPGREPEQRLIARRDNAPTRAARAVSGSVNSCGSRNCHIQYWCTSASLTNTSARRSRRAGITETAKHAHSATADSSAPRVGLATLLSPAIVRDDKATRRPTRRAGTERRQPT